MDNLAAPPATGGRFAHVAPGMTSDSESQAPVQPHAVGYREAPIGEVHATEAAVAALSRARPWAMMAMIVLFIAGGLGVAGGVLLLVIYAINNGRPGYDDVGPPNLVLGAAGLIYGLPLLVAGVLLASFIRAAGRTAALRRSEDLERAMVCLCWFWRWAALIMLGLLVSPFVVFGLAVATGAWD